MGYTLGDALSLEGYEIPSEPSSEDKAKYRNNAYNVVSAFGYLIGMDKKQFESAENPAMLPQIYEKLQKNKNARIVRNLCRIRSALERYYMPIANAFVRDVKNLGSLPEYIPTDAVQELGNDGVFLQKNRPDIDQYIIAINREISNRVSNVQTCFPEWLNFKYVKELFIMPDGFTKEGIKAEGAFYNSNRNRYPYQCYMNWRLDDVGNILFCDEKFVRLLYELNDDYFEDVSLVKNAGDLTIESINDFLMNSTKTIFVVDCENSNPMKLASMLGSLDEEVKSHISDVLLFDSHYTQEGWQLLSEENVETNAGTTKTAQTSLDDNLFDWGSLNDTAGMNMTHIVVERLIESKSQVDMTLAVRTTQEVYKNGVDSVVLVSSDSDYWAMISNMEEIHFLVMLEKEKTSHKITEMLDSKGIHHCFLDDFCTAMTYSIKTDALRNYIQSFLDANVSFEVDKLMDQAVYNSWLEMTDKEKKAFVENYIKKARVQIDSNGMFRVVLG